MSEKNYPEFRRLLRLAIGNSISQAKFAEESGISAEHLSRMLNDKKIVKPRLSTLKKIANRADNGVTLRDLVESVGDKVEYGAKEASREEIISSVADVANTLLKGFRGLSHGVNGECAVFRSVWDYVQVVAALFAAPGVAFCVDEPSAFSGKDLVSRVNASWKVSDAYAEIELGVVHVQDGDNVKITRLLVGEDAVNSISNLSSCFNPSDPHYKYLPDTNTLIDGDRSMRDLPKPNNPEPTVKKPADQPLTAEQRLLRAIFGEDYAPPKKTRPRSFEGIGFSLGRVTDVRVKNFLISHRDAFEQSVSGKDILAGIESGEDVRAVFERIGYRSFRPTCGFDPIGMAISDIISLESGMSVAFFMDPSEEMHEKYKNPPMVMYPRSFAWELSDEEEELAFRTVTNTLDRYARELGAEVDCHAYFLMDVPARSRPRV